MLLLSAALSLMTVHFGSQDSLVCQDVRFDVTLTSGPASVFGELCARGGEEGKTIQILVHGGSYDHRYWKWPYRPSQYSYVDYMTREGYATLAIDRIGVGRSTIPADGAALDFNVGASAVHQIVQQLRQGVRTRSLFGRVQAQKIELVGFSFGSFIATLEAATYGDVDAVVLTSYSHTLGPAAIASFGLAHPANEEWQFQTLPPTYLTTVPNARDDLFFYVPAVEPLNLLLDEWLKQTYTVGELSSIFPALGASFGVRAPTLVLNGENDLISCLAPTCTETNSLAGEAQTFPASVCVEVQTVPNVGHSMNLHRDAKLGFEAIARWSARRVGARENAVPAEPCAP